MVLDMWLGVEDRWVLRRHACDTLILSDLDGLISSQVVKFPLLTFPCFVVGQGAA